MQNAIHTQNRNTTIGADGRSAADSSKEFTVAIVGGGLCGVILAIGLARAGVRVQMYEAADCFKEIGASVTLGSNALHALKQSDILDHVLSYTGLQPTRDQLHYACGAQLPDQIQSTSTEDERVRTIHKVSNFTSQMGQLTLHRSRFLSSLTPLLPPALEEDDSESGNPSTSTSTKPSPIVHFNKRLTRITYRAKRDRYALYFDNTQAEGEDDGVTVHEADIVVGADGIRSAVRGCMMRNGGGVEVEVEEGCPLEDEDLEDGEEDHLEDYSPMEDRLSHTGSRVYRALVRHDDLLRAGLKMDLSTLVVTVGLRHNIFTAPLAGGALINIAAYRNTHIIPSTSAFSASHPSSPASTPCPNTLTKLHPTPLPHAHPDPEPSTSSDPTSYLHPPLPRPWVHHNIPNDDLLSEFDGWSEDVKILLRAAGDKSSVWFLHDMGEGLGSYVSRRRRARSRAGGRGSGGRVVLIGDAAHASTPHLGAGIGQGIEDVYLLTNLLTHPQTKLSNVEDILKTYDALRRPRANKVTSHSAAIGRLHASYAFMPHEEFVRRLDEYESVRTWINEHDVRDDLERAVGVLVKEGVFA